MKKVLAFVFLFSVLSFAQAPTPLPQAYLAAGAGYDAGGVQPAAGQYHSRSFAWAEYDRLTGLDAGTGKAVYNFFNVQTYRFTGGLQAIKQATEFTTGLSYVFYDKMLLSNKARVTLSVDGAAGLSSVSTGNVGYSIQAKVKATVTHPGWKWGVRAAIQPSHSSVAGNYGQQFTFGPIYSFNGF